MKPHPNLRDLPLPLKVLFTSFLLTIGVAYLFALMYLYLIDIEPHRGMKKVLIHSTILKYYGNRGDTRLEVALKGVMGENLTADEKKEISAWIKEGATAEGFSKVQPIFSKNCAECHNPDTGLIPLTTYEEVRSITNIDLGESIRTLARVSISISSG